MGGETIEREAAAVGSGGGGEAEHRCSYYGNS